MVKIYSRDEVSQLRTKGFIREIAVSSSNLAKILDRMEQDNFHVWSRTEIEFVENTKWGYNMCGRCGELYPITIVFDAYKVRNSEYRVCNGCMNNLSEI